MAPLRSSRHTRHHDPNTTPRAGRATTDFDPTDGLPVRRFVLESIIINQDASAEATDPVNAAANKQGLAAKDNFPWPEQPLPTFFDQLPPHNQELLRRARAGERETKASIWDRKAHEWVRYEDARKRGLTGESGMRKSRYLMNVTNEDGDENAAENEDDASDDNSEDDNNDGDNDVGANGDSGATTAAPKTKKRKKPPTQLLQDRTFDVKKWTQVPFDKADKMPEAKYLADRRPGMANYYNQSVQGAWAHAQGYGIGIEGGAAGGGPAYDLGDGSGLGNAIGGQQPGSETPVRKNMPPRPRKKKGGPGRKKKEVVEAERRAAEEARRKAEAEARGEVVAEAGEGDGSVKKEVDTTAAGEGEAGSETPRSKRDGGEGSGDDSEGDGSEDGEINDGNESGSATPSVSGAAAAPTSILGLGLNAPAIPSSLSREVAMGAADDTAGAGPSTAAATNEDAATAPPALSDTQMPDAPAPSAAEANAPVPPPAAEAIVPAPLIIDPAATVTPTRPPQPPSPTLDPSPITPEPGAADEAVSISLTDSPPTVPASIATEPSAPSAPQQEITVPFDPTAAEETAPLLQGVEVPTAEQIDAAATATGPIECQLEAASQEAGGTPKEVREEEAVREAAVQGEAEEFAAVEEEMGAVPLVEVGGEAAAAVAVEEEASKEAELELERGDEKEKEKETEEGVEEGAGNALDLLGGLEREVEQQQGRED